MHAQPAPLLVLLDGAPGPWQEAARSAGWRFLAPWEGSREKSIDLRIQTLQSKLAAARAAGGIDDTRVYLAGQGDGAAALFYVVSRVPDLWTAAVAVGGTARPAIDSNRLFGANTGNVPVLWLFGDPAAEPQAKRLQEAGYNLEWKLEPSATASQVFQWLAAHTRDALPARIDCETGAPAFARCYWIRMTRFDPSERNDALDSTRVRPMGSGASLDLGGFGFNASAPGPGVTVSWLPPNYRGPLKMGDRIVAIAGKSLADAAAYSKLMDETTEDRVVAVTVQRGKERLRQETRIVVPRREETITARVQAQYDVASHEMLVMSRAVAEMRIDIPAAWTPVTINWNGVETGKVETPGCRLLKVDKGLLTGGRCP